MRLGRRAAYLRKCILVQELLSKYENETTVRKRIFEQYIQPAVLCSYMQFNNMLNVRNPKNELDGIEAILSDK